MRNTTRPSAKNCKFRDRPQASAHTASARTATNGKMLCFANVIWAGSRLPKRTALFCTEPLQSNSEAGRLKHGARSCKRSRDRLSVPAEVSGIATLPSGERIVLSSYYQAIYVPSRTAYYVDENKELRDSLSSAAESPVQGVYTAKSG